MSLRGEHQYKFNLASCPYFRFLNRHGVQFILRSFYLPHPWLAQVLRVCISDTAYTRYQLVRVSSECEHRYDMWNARRSARLYCCYVKRESYSAARQGMQMLISVAL